MATLALCIPAYNASWCLPKLFSSVEKQSVPFDEVLVYDDCSSDDTVAVAKAHGATVVSGKVNKGCSFGKNQLAQHAKSEWLFFLDSDDELLPDFSTNVHKVIGANHLDADMIVLSYIYVDGSTDQVKDAPVLDEQLLRQNSFRFMVTQKFFNSFVVRRNKFLSIGGFDTDPLVLYNEDRACAVKTALNGFRYEFIKYPCMKKNFFPESMSSKQPVKWITASVCLWQKIGNQVQEQYKPDVCDALFTEAIWAGKYNEWALVRNALKIAKELKTDALPSASKPFLFLFKTWPLGAYFFREYLFRVLKRGQ
ncbi:glycosyltransferase family 2 protein [Flavisolibacter nicotianae]|uniref:glycosyltransferase family 2 protein n=1 Tax=Flavisolibacter nicotianae TaxID=2364882 RepID=UPI000EB2AECE|nr:glycosyltransferase family 2 protein [Flavisolibacter nicotianae]